MVSQWGVCELTEGKAVNISPSDKKRDISGFHIAEK